jgi:hypothetical protein
MSYLAESEYRPLRQIRFISFLLFRYPSYAPYRSSNSGRLLECEKIDFISTSDTSKLKSADFFADIVTRMTSNGDHQL